MKLLTYRVAAQLSGAVCAALCVTLLCAPEVVFWLFDLAEGDTARVLAKRAGVLFLGLALILFLTRTHAPNPSRRVVQTACAVMLGAMALLGALDWARGAVGAGIWCAIFVEILLAGVLVIAD
ncbi:hypothetical protein [Dinoroseobacter sp. S76]|uniref:hypothetical protein n=1 Tax=Dinoroseobacter sp. S76 TaxID=3415124 RepID=UPI003C7A5FAB